MKCINCGSEWIAKGTYSQVRSCPFCGESLSPASEDDITLDSVLKNIFDQFGTDLLLDRNKFIAVFVDMAPKFKQEKKIISIALNESIAPLLINEDNKDEIIVLEQITTKLNDIMAPSAIRLIVSSFLPALGWSINPDNIYSYQQRNEEIELPQVEEIRSNGICQEANKTIIEVPIDAVNEERIRFDGVYQYRHYDYSSYLRFFSDGKVVEVPSTGTASQVCRWLNHNYESFGFYTINNGTVSFTITSSEGQVNYSGRILKDAIEINLTSHINGHRANNLRYIFVGVK